MNVLKGKGFLVSLVGLIFLAWWMPQLGGEDGLLRARYLITPGIVVIFLIQGLALPTRQMLQNLGRWQIHGVCQSFTFLIFPALAFGGCWLAGDALDPVLRLAILYFSILPTTVSTAAVFTANAGGNRAMVVVNIVLSSLLGIVLVPTWIWMVAGAEVQFDFLQALTRVMMMVALPLMIGQMLRPLLATWVDRWKKVLSYLSNAIILMIVFESCCRAFQTQTGIPLSYVAGVMMACVGLLAVVSWLNCLAGITMKLSRPDKVALYFCGTQKSLAVGAGMLPSLFGTDQAAAFYAVMLLPILVYHILQLLVGGWLCGNPRFFSPAER